MNIAKFLRTRIFKNMYERLFLYFRILKKICFEKWKNDKSKTRKSRKSRKSRKNYCEFSYFRVFDFALQPKSKIGFEILRKKFPRFPRFQPGQRNLFFLLTRSSHWNVLKKIVIETLDFILNTLYIIWQGFHLLVKLQAFVSNKMKSLTGIYFSKLWKVHKSYIAEELFLPNASRWLLLPWNVVTMSF